MAKKTKTIFGFCPTHADAEEAVDRLRLSGFRNTDVSACLPDGIILQGVLEWVAGEDAPKPDNKDYEGWVRDGGIVLCVRCNNSDWISRAERILQPGRAAAAAC